MIEKEHELHVLAAQIAENGGLPDAVVGVISDGDSVEILEGNRRLFVAQILAGAAPMPERWSKKVKKEIGDLISARPFPTTIPVKIYKDISRDQLQARLAIDHISGKRQWSPLRKAHFGYSLLIERTNNPALECNEVGDLRKVWHELSNTDQDVLKQVAHLCGFKNDKVNTFRYRTMAFVANCLYCRLYDTSEQRERFDVFRRFYEQKWWRDMADGVQPRLKEGKEQRDIMWPDSEIEEKFMNWLAEGKIGETLHLDTLHLLLDNETTRVKFEEEGHKAAFALYKKLNEPDEITSDEVFATAHAELASISANSLKHQDGQKVRQSLKELKAALSQLEFSLGEAL